MSVLLRMKSYDYPLGILKLLTASVVVIVSVLASSAVGRGLAPGSITSKTIRYRYVLLLG